MSIPANFKVAKQVRQAISAVDTCPAIAIKYIGAPAVDAQVSFGSFDLLFYTDYSATTKDTQVFQTGVTAGHIETDKAAADMTFGTLAAIINASTNWRATLIGALHDDLVYTHSGTVQACVAVTINGANAKGVASETGTVLYWDTSVVNHASLAIGPESMGADFADFTARVSARNTSRVIDANDRYSDDEGATVPGATAVRSYEWRSTVEQIIETGSVASSTLTSVVKVYDASQDAYAQIYQRAGGADAAQTTFDSDSGLPLISSPGRRLLVRVTVAGATPTIADLQVQGAIGFTE